MSLYISMLDKKNTFNTCKQTLHSFTKCVHVLKHGKKKIKLKIVHSALCICTSICIKKTQQQQQKKKTTKKK